MAAQRGDERRDNYAPVGPFGHFGSAAFSFACNAGNVPDANKWTRDALTSGSVASRLVEREACLHLSRFLQTGCPPDNV